MRSWLTLLGGLIIWAIHFFALYAVGSIFLTTDLARALTLALTVMGLAAIGLLGRSAWRSRPADAPGRWARSVSLWGAAIGGVAVGWQGLVALLI